MTLHTNTCSTQLPVFQLCTYHVERRTSKGLSMIISTQMLCHAKIWESNKQWSSSCPTSYNHCSLCTVIIAAIYKLIWSTYYEVFMISAVHLLTTYKNIRGTQFYPNNRVHCCNPIRSNKQWTYYSITRVGISTLPATFNIGLLSPVKSKFWGFKSMCAIPFDLRNCSARAKGR